MVFSNATMTSLVSSAALVTAGNGVTLTAKVHQVDSTASLAGTIDFYENGTLLGAVTMTGGVSTYVVPSLSVGSYSFTAVYPGSSVLSPSSSAPVNVTATTQTVFTVTAQNATRNFAAANPAFGFTLANSTGGAVPVVTGMPAYTTSAMLNSAAGSYAITPSVGTLSTSPGYAFNFVNGTLTVNANAPETITFQPIPNVPLAIGHLTLTAHTTSGGLGQPIGYTVTGPAVISGSTLTLTGAGRVTVTATEAGNTTFAAATAVVQSFTVTP